MCNFLLPGILSFSMIVLSSGLARALGDDWRSCLKMEPVIPASVHVLLHTGTTEIQVHVQVKP